jgi:hypothetical protein
VASQVVASREVLSSIELVGYAGLSKLLTSESSQCRDIALTRCALARAEYQEKAANVDVGGWGDVFS